MKKLLALAFASLISTASFAASYPDRPIKLIVPWAAGGDTDLIFRPLLPLLQKYLGQPVIIANVGGAPLSVLRNADSARVYGIEADASLRFSDAFDMRLAGAWIDAKYDKFQGAAINVPCTNFACTSTVGKPRATMPRAMAANPSLVMPTTDSGSSCAMSKPSDTTSAPGPQAMTAARASSKRFRMAVTSSPGFRHRFNVVPRPAPSPRSSA